MPRLLAAFLTCVVSAVLATGAAFGIVAALDATPEQQNVPLVTFPDPPADGASSTPGPGSD
ncbi:MULTISPECIES: hypothetical protein [Streptomyces]|uniref:SPW_0924 family protein n=2 Tax=Streptomyces TaxID=1883 RepID=A0A3R7F613_9ACTN|nr:MULTISPECIES: hypothetical protein [Streptomyces]KNE81275.1 hypothetical protein ADZ36_17170 [Streptomyces fradiae]OFA57839.1 hypothetical protein BEN35_04700 [Streptomyces fradiae]PQM23667.1 hypothetical protein Sfr7A_08495 [Streptomyces xinghaiensis]RKM91655.1 hypothetical protein SFRA_027015 [Streptomyces xinghaiensis]RNC73360.1 hypothetical protein DC095_014615 [Streptomyces xinghaiensis]